MIQKVEDLLFRADFFIQSHKRLYKVYHDNMPSGGISQTIYINLPCIALTVLNANLYFFEALSCLASLLRDSHPKNPDKDEISFHKLKERIPDAQRGSFQTSLDSIFSEYKDSSLDVVRNKYVDHKDLNLSGDPSAAFINFASLDLVNSCSTLIDSLKRLYREHIADTTANNYFSDYYSKGINEYVAWLTAQSGGRPSHNTANNDVPSL